MNTDAILILILAVTIFLVLWGGYKLLFEKRVKAQEYVKDVVSSGGASQAKSSLLQKQDVVLKKRKSLEDENFIDRLSSDLERANMRIRANEYILFTLVVGFVLFLMTTFVLALNPFVGFIIAVAGTGSAFLFLKIKIWLRMRKAEAQFADVLDALVSCFKTGFAFNRAIQQISDGFDDPWGTEFGKMVAEMNLGATQETSLLNLARRIPTTDVDLFVTALIIQKDTGGNMSELLGNLSNTCRERFKLKRKVSSISAQGKLSAGIVTAIPFGLMGIIFMFLPEPVMSFVTNPFGIVILVVTGIWMAIGIGVLF